MSKQWTGGRGGQVGVLVLTTESLAGATQLLVSVLSGSPFLHVSGSLSICSCRRTMLPVIIMCELIFLTTYLDKYFNR